MTPSPPRATVCRLWSRMRPGRLGALTGRQFTAEEAWLTRFPNEVSVHLRQFLQTPDAWREDSAVGDTPSY